MKNIKIISYCTIAIAIFTGCLKKIDIPQTNNITVSLNGSGVGYLTSDVTLNPKDSIFLDYAISSPGAMKYVTVQKNGADLYKDTLAVPGTSFAKVRRFIADSATGVYTYRILAKDIAGVYLGSRDVSVTISPDFIFYSERRLQVPDSVAKATKSYFSISTGETFSYTEGMNKSALIDFGYFYDTSRVMAGSPAVLTPKGHTIYSLTNTVTPYLPYDISAWTKNATLLKLTTSVTFSSLTSSGALRTAGLAALGSGTVTRVSTTDRATASQANHLTGAVILFKTVSGKYGAISINYTNDNGSVNGSYINIDVKVQK